jgi:Mg-chelatase subunit ChlD
MRTRHKIPTIFNLSMVDVLCCALGCVILLWLVNFREAKRRTLAAGETAARLDAATRDLADVRRQLQDAEALARGLQSERDAALANVAATSLARDKAMTQLSDLDKRLAALRLARTAADDQLAKKDKDLTALQKDLAALEKDRDSLRSLLREKDTLARAAAKGADDLAARLREANLNLKRLQSLADQLPDLRKELSGYRDKSSGAETRLASLEKELAQSRALADQLRDDKKLLAHQMARARADADNRFAGIALTGRRVVFLVDMSGSMEFVDEKTPAPDKWLGVRQTLAKIARSLPELEKFQVIVFAREASFLLGNEGRWLSFDPQTSVDKITQALAATKPKGATNMYAALEAAFRLRADGLDTIYLLSDGLPNVGAGLAPEAAAKMKETEKAEILGNYVRKTLKTIWNRPALDRPRVRINAVGFFYESPDVGAFLWALARENDGSFVGMSKPLVSIAGPNRLCSAGFSRHPGKRARPSVRYDSRLVRTGAGGTSTSVGRSAFMANLQKRSSRPQWRTRTRVGSQVVHAPHPLTEEERTLLEEAAKSRSLETSTWARSELVALARKVCGVRSGKSG